VFGEKIEAAGPFKMLVTTYHTIWCNIREGHNLNKICNELTCCGLVGYANVTLLKVTSATREWYGIFLPPVIGIDDSKFMN
jgi:hypothetical protein